jgi:hypothetical protein
MLCFIKEKKWLRWSCIWWKTGGVGERLQDVDITLLGRGKDKSLLGKEVTPITFSNLYSFTSAQTHTGGHCSTEQSLPESQVQETVSWIKISKKMSSVQFVPQERYSLALLGGSFSLSSDILSSKRVSASLVTGMIADTMSSQVVPSPL